MHSNATDRILRLKAVLALTGLTRSTLYRKMEAGTCPASTQISTRCIGWRESAVTCWIDDPMRPSAALGQQGH
nr:AlpA family phage regulatory protein [Sphingomonas sp. TDK1]